MLELIWPYTLLALPVPLLIRWWLKPQESEQSPLAVPSVESFTFSSSSAISEQTSAWPLWLLIGAWIALVVAGARPQWTGEPVSLPTSGRDLMLAVDISGSMSVEDMTLRRESVDRLTVVKSVVGDFIDRRNGDRVGLILFGTNAYLQAPLTFDLTSVDTLLTEAPVGIAGGKTAIGDAIGLAVKRLRSRPEGDRVLVLLTDGANNVGKVQPLKAAELAHAADVRIHTIGVGADEMTVRDNSLFGFLGPRRVNPSADLDEDTLTDIASSTGGQYFRARNTEELEGIYDLINELEPVEQDAEVFRPRKQLFFYPLALGLFLFSLVLLNQITPIGRAAPRTAPGNF